MTNEYKLVSLNIDTNLGRLEDGPFRKYFPGFKVANRIPSLIAFIKTVDPDIVCLQEGRRVDLLDLDSISPFIDEFSNDYHVLVNKYNPSAKAFSYITMFRKSMFDVKNYDLYYLTDTPRDSTAIEQLTEYAECNPTELKTLVNKWKTRNHGDEFERAVAYFIVRAIATEQDFVVINAHMGISRSMRLFASKKINDLIYDLTETDGHRHFILSGDFNSFQDDGGAEQMMEINIGEVPITHYVNDYRVSLDQTTKMLAGISTFHYYPYDFAFNIGSEIKAMIEKLFVDIRSDNGDDVDKIADQTMAVFGACHNYDLYENRDMYPLGGHLDHVLVRSINTRGYVVPVWMDGVKAVGFDFMALYPAIVAEYERTKQPMLASDHQALLVYFTLA